MNRVLNAAVHVRSAISLEHSNVVWAVQRAVPNHWNAKGLYQSMLIIQLVRNNFHLFFTLCEGKKTICISAHSIIELSAHDATVFCCALFIWALLNAHLSYTYQTCVIEPIIVNCRFERIG